MNPTDYSSELWPDVDVRYNHWVYRLIVEAWRRNGDAIGGADR